MMEVQRDQWFPALNAWESQAPWWTEAEEIIRHTLLADIPFQKLLLSRTATLFRNTFKMLF